MVHARDAVVVTEYDASGEPRIVLVNPAKDGRILRTGSGSRAWHGPNERRRQRGGVRRSRLAPPPDNHRTLQIHNQSSRYCPTRAELSSAAWLGAIPAATIDVSTSSDVSMRGPAV